MDADKKRRSYLDLSHQYFHDKITIDELIAELEKFIDISVDAINIPLNERVMIITNHPSADETLTLPAEHIGGVKGGNTRNFPSFWFPVVRQALLRKALDRRFLTVAHDIGWSVAMQELWHLLIPHVPGGRLKHIVSCVQKDTDCSLVVFPEGGVRQLEVFHTGFFYMALKLEIKYLITASFSPVLSLNGENRLKVLQVEDIGTMFQSVTHFVERKRMSIAQSIAE